MTDNRSNQTVVFIGTQRENSSSEMALRYVASKIENAAIGTRIFGGKFLANLWRYDPSYTSRTPAERDFIKAVRECIGIVVATPTGLSWQSFRPGEKCA